MASFKSYNLSNTMVEGLESLGYTNPSEIQELVIPKLLRKESVLATSQTGSGKTHSFLIPIIDKIDLNNNQIQAIIVAPTRELAKQTFTFAREFQQFFPKLKIQLLSSEIAKNRNVEALANTPHLIVATPGRLSDVATKEKVINLSEVTYLVLDEADMLMELGFFEDIEKILMSLNNPIVSVFSATINDKIGRLIERYISSDNYIKLDNYTSLSVEHVAIDIKHQSLENAVLDFIKIKPSYLLLVFASKIETVDKIYRHLKSNGVKVGVIHGDLPPRERKNRMKRIINDEFSVIVCSDMAARGIDLDNVTDVLSVDLPKDLSFYFHRAGRTGRFNASGVSYVFYNVDTISDMRRLLALNVDFKYLVLKNDSLQEGKKIDEKKVFKSRNNTELEKEIKKAISVNKSNKVRPGYKKKVKDAVEKAKRKYRRDIIKKDIKKRQVERAKEKNRNYGN